MFTRVDHASFANGMIDQAILSTHYLNRPAETGPKTIRFFEVFFLHITFSGIVMHGHVHDKTVYVDYKFI